MAIAGIVSKSTGFVDRTGQPIDENATVKIFIPCCKYETGKVEWFNGKYWITFALGEQTQIELAIPYCEVIHEGQERKEN